MTSQTKARTRVGALKDESCGGTVAYRMHVMARDVVELTVNAGGLIVDRMMSGWRVTVQLVEGAGPGGDDARPVQILGAELVDAEASSAHRDEEECVLVCSGDAFARMTSAQRRQFPTEWAEVLVWGESPEPAQLFGHDLSAAAQAFKALASAAAGVPGDQVTVAENFTSMTAGSGEVPLRA